MPTEAGAEAARRRYWDDIGRRWLAERPDSLWHRCSDAIYARWLDRVADDFQGGRVLKTDLFNEAIGGGLAEWFERRGSRVLGCDLALSTTEGAAAQHASIAAVVADVRRLPFLSGALDGVLSDSTLDHFERESDIQAALCEIRRILRPGGTLLVTLDNPRNPLVWLRNLRPAFWIRLGLVPYTVGATCSLRRLEQLLVAAGFEVETRGAIVHSPRVLLVPLCRWIERRGARAEPAPWWLRWLLRIEHLENLPSRLLTGHFVAIRARAARLAKGAGAVFP
jgi:SAM-dependent methyltransferase